MSQKRLLVSFSEVDKDDVALVGGKGANLGEMTKAKFPVPPGFIVTAQGYFDFIKENNLSTKIKHLLATVNYEKSESMQQVSNHIKKEIMRSLTSEELNKLVFVAYKKLGGIFHDGLVAVRSSATAEDLPTASFAGQQETFLNIKGEANLMLKIKEAWASLFTPRAIFYRHQHHFGNARIGIAIVIQKMVASEKSGVMFTIDPVTNDKTKIIIEAIYGLGELIVQGKVTPDHYEVDKKNLSIMLKRASQQDNMLKKVGSINKEVRVSKHLGSKQKISDIQIIELARLGAKLEKHYYFPQDVEWAIEKNKIFIVQTRPVTTISSKFKVQSSKLEKEKEAMENGKWKMENLLLRGDPASPGIASGPAKIIKSAKEIHKVQRGDILVAPQTNPDFVSAMKKAVAIVAEKGGRTSHAAIVSRELGIPAIVGAEKATSIIKQGNVITVNGTKGEIYSGGFKKPSSFSTYKPQEFLKTATKVYVNLGEPELAENIAKRNVDGVGLLRAEFMMSEIGIHPKKLIRDGRKHFFVQKMLEGIEVFCKAFDPRPIVYRTSDFKTNEYRELLGGKDFELQESNPMIGYRGAFRYINDPQVFELEIEAVKLIREKKGFKNLWMMIPYVRTVKELIQVKKLISNSGLYRSQTFKLWMMVEIPSNVVLLEKFISVGIDGISIGSNDLTQLMLGTDRDNQEIARVFNEQDESVLWALEHAIKTAHKYKITSSICGQAPSSYSALVEKLVKWGVTSISVSPDVIEKTREIIYESEKRVIG